MPTMIKSLPSCSLFLGFPPESLRARETTQCPYRCETPSLWARRRAPFSPAVIALLRGAPLESRIGFRNALFEPQKREKHEEREFAQEKPTRRMIRCGRRSRRDDTAPNDSPPDQVRKHVIAQRRGRRRRGRGRLRRRQGRRVAWGRRGRDNSGTLEHSGSGQTSRGELCVDAVSCERVSHCISSSFALRHDASVDADGFFQEPTPTADALDLVYYHSLARNTSSLRQRSFEGCLLSIGKGQRGHWQRQRDPDLMSDHGGRGRGRL